MRGLIASGHKDAESFAHLFDFREWLVQLREDDANRQRARRDGNVKSRADGSPVMGPFTLTVRMRILKRLQAMEKEIGQNLISKAELEVIEDIWRRDKLRDDCRIALCSTLISKPEGVLI